MKRYIGVIVGLVAFVVGSVIMYGRVNDKVAVAEQVASFEKLQSAYLERVGWIRANPDEKGYREEVNPFLKGYFKSVDEHLARFDGNKDFDDYLIRVEKKGGGAKKGGGDPKVHYDYVKAQFDTLRAGKHDPTFTATDKGMRLDVVTEEKMVAGEPNIRYRVLLWGAQREMKEDGKLKKMVTSSSFGVAWKFWDERGKLLAEMNASEPSMKIDWPELFIAEFPPQMVFGHYDVGLVHFEVKKAEITFTVNSRSQTGGEANAQYTWKLDVPPEWKLSKGDKWVGAEETTREPEEIGGR